MIHAIALLLLAAVATQAALPLPEASASSTAAQLAVAATPDDAVAGAAMRARLRTMIGANPSFSTLETRYPGISEHVLRALAPNVTRLATEQSKMSRERMTMLFRTALKPDQIDAALRLFRSDAGRHLVAASTASLTSRAAVDGAATLRDRLQADPTTAVSSAEFRDSMLMPAAPAALAGLTADDRLRIAQFNASPAGRAWQAMQPKMMALGAEATNAAMQRELPALTAVITTAANNYIHAHDEAGK